jgi:hypothetical protein
LENNFPLQEVSHNKIGIYAKILQFFLIILTGGKKFSHLLHLGEGSELLADIFAAQRMPKTSSTLTRLFGKLKRWATVEQLADSLWKFCFSLIPWQNHSSDYLSFDSTVLVRHGKQEGAKKGYNPKKRGRPSHHPLLAFLNQCRYVVNFWNRSGNASSSNNILAFAAQTIERLKDRLKILGVLADSAFYGIKFIRFLEEKCLEYVIAVPFSKIIQWQSVSETLCWRLITPGIEIAEFNFQHKAKDWDKPRRYVVVREDKRKVKEALGKQLTLFGEDSLWNKNYFYRVYISNSLADAVTLWRRYRGRADDENRIKELAYDFGLTGFSLKKFYSTEAALLLVVFLYNLFNFFRREILSKGEGNQTAGTIRYKYWTIPGVGGKRGNQAVLRLGVGGKKLRAKFRYLLSRIINGFFDCGVELQCI